MVEFVEELGKDILINPPEIEALTPPKVQATIIPDYKVDVPTSHLKSALVRKRVTFKDPTPTRGEIDNEHINKFKLSLHTLGFVGALIGIGFVMFMPTTKDNETKK